MKILNTTILLSVLALNLLSAGCVSAPPAFAKSDQLIVPGERVGPIRFGMTDQELVKTMGTPDDVYPFMGRWLGYSFPSSVIVEVLDSTREVDGVQVNVASTRTSQGLGIGSTYRDIVLALGPPVFTNYGPNFAAPAAVYYGSGMTYIEFSFCADGSSIMVPPHSTVQFVRVGNQQYCNPL